MVVVECPRPAPPCLTLAPPLPALECAPISRASPPLPLPPSLSTPSRPSLPPFEPPAVLMRVPTRCPPVPRFPHCSESGCRTPAVNPQPPKEEATGGVGWSRGGGGSTCERLPSPYHPAPPPRGPPPPHLDQVLLVQRSHRLTQRQAVARHDLLGVEGSKRRWSIGARSCSSPSATRPPTLPHRRTLRVQARQHR